jgi:hypothetical protein
MRSDADTRQLFRPCGTQGRTRDGAGQHSPSARRVHQRGFDRRSEASCRPFAAEL